MKNLIINKLIQKIKNAYNTLLRPLRNLALKRYMDRPVILFAGKETAEEGGLYLAIDYNGVDNVLKLQPIGDNDTAFDVPVWAKPTEVNVYSLDGTEFVKLTVLNIYSRTIGRF